MNALRFNCHALTAIALTAFIVGCGGAGTTASVPPAITLNTAHHATSSDGDLLYVDDSGVNGCCAYVLVYTYPDGKLAQTLKGFNFLHGECSDNEGNVFI